MPDVLRHLGRKTGTGVAFRAIRQGVIYEPNESNRRAPVRVEPAVECIRTLDAAAPMLPLAPYSWMKNENYILPLCRPDEYGGWRVRNEQRPLDIAETCMTAIKKLCSTARQRLRRVEFWVCNRLHGRVGASAWVHDFTGNRNYASRMSILSTPTTSASMWSQVLSRVERLSRRSQRLLGE